MSYVLSNGRICIYCDNIFYKALNKKEQKKRKPKYNIKQKQIIKQT